MHAQNKFPNRANPQPANQATQRSTRAFEGRSIHEVFGGIVGKGNPNSNSISLNQLAHVLNERQNMLNNNRNNNDWNIAYEIAGQLKNPPNGPFQDLVFRVIQIAVEKGILPKNPNPNDFGGPI
ncbi:MAG: hypothetical protein N3G22_01480 [Candidatus Micrarchaeota archaeon]|nr:hypothetical protein [Candidatus Micrarchaeota archaeon]